MNLTGLHDRVVINKENFKGIYWSGRKYNFYNYWKKLDVKHYACLAKMIDMLTQ